MREQIAKVLTCGLRVNLFRPKEFSLKFDKLCLDGPLYTVNSEIFMTVLFSQYFAYAKFHEYAKFS